MNPRYISIKNNKAGGLIIALFLYAAFIIRFLSDSLGSSLFNGVVNLSILMTLSIVFLYLNRVNRKNLKVSLGLIFLLTLYLLNNIIYGKDLYYKELFRLIFVFFVGFFIYSVHGTGFFRNSKSFIIISAWVLVLVGFFQFIVGDYRIIEGTKRLNGTYSHPNPYGMHLALIIMYIFHMIKKDENKNGYGYYSICFLFFLSMAVFSQVLNFSALLSLILYFVLYFSFMGNAGLAPLKIIVCVVLSFILMALLYESSDIFKQRIDYILLTGFDTSMGYALNSIQWRLINWMHYIQNIDNYAFGNGIGASDIFYQNWSWQGFKVLAPHNEWLKILFEYGLFGISCLMLFIYSVIRRVSFVSSIIIIAFCCAAFFDNFFKATSLLIFILLLIESLESSNKSVQFR